MHLFYKQGNIISRTNNYFYGFFSLTCYIDIEAATKVLIQNRCSGQLVGQKQGEWGRNCTYGRLRVLRAVIVLLMLSSAISSYAGDAKQDLDRKYDIDVPAFNAAKALNKLAEQTDSVLLFPYKAAKARQANAVAGHYTLTEALSLLLQGSGLSGGLSKNGAIQISLVENERLNREIEESDVMKSKTGMFAVVVAFLFASGVMPALAQDEDAGETRLEEIIVTGVAEATRKLDSSVSITSFEASETFKLAYRSTAEIFRSLPGIRSESSGGQANANITVRGIPLATGGSKFLQIHEDGLPIQEFGDVNFGNAEQYIRADYSLDRIESIRGGSASTFASNSPGGIINLISKTGEEEGGSVGVSYGLDYQHKRVDFEYGQPLTDTLRFHVGGFAREGEGIRDAGFNAESGYQIKFNMTKEFDNGYLRLYAKRLDDNVITYHTAPARFDGGGDFSAIPGFDGSDQTIESSLNSTFTTFDAFGNSLQRSFSDGVESNVDSYGVEASFDLAYGWNVTNKFRTSSVSGGTISEFIDGGSMIDAQTWGDNRCRGFQAAPGVPAGAGSIPATESCVTTVTYAYGPDAGQPYSGLAANVLVFDADIESQDITVNDFKLSKDFNLSNDIDDTTTVTFGFYTSKQDIRINWGAWQFWMKELSGDDASLLNVAAPGPDGLAGSADDRAVVENGIWWPGLLSFAWDLEYDILAPYFNIGVDLENFNFDASVRQDFVDAVGQLVAGCCGSTGGFDFNRNGMVQPFESLGLAVAVGPGQRVDYDHDYTSYSVGGSWAFTDNQSVFARYSVGHRAVADRLLQIGGALRADGTPVDDPDDKVTQIEVGYKLIGDNYDLFATFFNTDTEETQAEFTSGSVFIREYSAIGVELEGAYRFGNLSLNGNLTWTDAEIEADANDQSVVGNTPRRQADVIYTFTPEYSTDRFSVGATLQGSTSFYIGDNNALKQGAYVLVNLFGNYRISDALSLSVSVNNVTDEFVITEAEDSVADVGDIVRARVISGRSSILSLRYDF